MAAAPPSPARRVVVRYALRNALAPAGATVELPPASKKVDYEAEVAFVVQDGFQGRGLGVVLLHHLLEAGDARGIRRFRAYVLGDNTRMLDLIARFTDIRERSLDAGVASILFERRAVDS